MVNLDILNDPLVNDIRLLRPDIKAAFAVMSARIKRAQAERLTAGRTEWPSWLRECFPGFFSAEFAPHHQMFWEHIWSIKPEIRPKPFLAVWPRGGGKCLDGETLVVCSDGSRRRIADLKIGQGILSLNETTGHFEEDRIIAHWASGVKRCLEIRTRTGKVLRLTPEHKVLTFEGWKLASELKSTERIASPRRLPIHPTEFHPDAEVRLLAYMLAEGCTRGNQCNFTNADEVIVQDFTSCAEAMGFYVKPARRFRYYLMAPQVRGQGKRGVMRSLCRRWVAEQGMYDCLAIHKRVPRWVFGLPARQIWMFLAAMIDTDGWIMPDRGRVAITLGSWGMITDLQQLLTQVGVLSGIHYHPNRCNGAWVLCFDQESLRDCLQHLPLRLKLQKLIEACEIPRYSLIDTYPASLLRHLAPGLNRFLRDHCHVRVGNRYAITRAKLRRVIDVYPEPRWIWLEQADIFWDEIAEISDAGELETYDVEVEKHHNLVTSELISHNSSSAEVSTILLGVHGERHYALYVSGTQDQADKHVESIAGLLESAAFAARYPTFANRRLGKYGHSRGWRRNRLHTESGFMIDAAGLDRAVRGIKAENVRPDVIIFDDIDDLLDSPATVAKKIKVLTRSILPAGSTDVAIIGVQNLIHEGSIFNMLATHKTDFLLDHTMSGPIPAVNHLEYVLDSDGTYEIIAGEPTWAGQNLDQCQALIDDIGLSAFLIESQHNVEDTKGGIYEHIEFQHCDWDEMPTLERIVVWVDPAVTNTDDSDSHGIQADGLGVDGKLYRLFSWEGRTSPEESLKRAMQKALELKAECVGVETDQGGDTWASTYRLTAQEAGIKNPPAFRSAKAGAGHGPKAHRQAQMVASYERGEIIHVRGTHTVLERGLKRFGVRKPLDLADAAYWSWFDLQGGLAEGLTPSEIAAIHATHQRQPYALGRRLMGGTRRGL